jgi:hypothetical protein
MLAFSYYLALLYSDALGNTGLLKGRLAHSVSLLLPVVACGALLYFGTKKLSISATRRWVQIVASAVLGPWIAMHFVLLWFFIRTGETL